MAPRNYTCSSLGDAIFLVTLRVWIYLLRKCAYRDFLHIILSTHNKQQTGIKISVQKKGGKSYDSYKYVLKFQC